MIQHPKLEALLLSGDPDNITLGLELAVSQEIDIEPLLEDMAQLVNFLVASCGYMIFYEKLTDLPFLLSEIRELSVTSFFLKEELLSIPDKLEYLPNLEEIDLVGVGLRYLPASIGCCRKLRKLNLLENELRTLPPTLANCSALQHINLSNNPLDVFPTPIPHLANLERLHMSQTALVDILEEIGNLKALKYLNLSHNLIFGLPERFADLSHLEELSLFDCKIEELPDNFGDLVRLKTLKLLGNPILNWPKNIGLPALEFLSITNFPTQLKHGGLKELRIVINQNPTIDIGEYISNFTNINKLQIYCVRGENLTAIDFPVKLLSLKNLKNIEIKNVKLKSIPAAYKRAYQLEKLYIFNSGLEDLTKIQAEFAEAYAHTNTKVIIT